MANVNADLDVQRFGYAGDGQGRRLLFPSAQTHVIEGRAGQTTYGAADCSFEGLEGRLDTLRWQAESASVGSAWLRDDAGRFDVNVQRAELPHGIRLVRAADANIELLAPHPPYLAPMDGTEARAGLPRRPASPPRPPCHKH